MPECWRGPPARKQFHWLVLLPAQRGGGGCRLELMHCQNRSSSRTVRRLEINDCVSQLNKCSEGVCSISVWSVTGDSTAGACVTSDTSGSIDKDAKRTPLHTPSRRDMPQSQEYRINGSEGSSPGVLVQEPKMVDPRLPAG